MRKGFTSIKELMPSTFEQIENLQSEDSALVGIKTGFTDLDTMTNGLHKGELIIVAGRPSMGKSALVMNMPVLDMDAYPDQAKARILELARRAVEEDGAEVIILGCAGLTGYAEDVERELGVVVLDPTSVAFKLAEAMADLGLRHSKIARFAQPPVKEIK